MTKKRSRFRWFLRGIGCGMVVFVLLLVAATVYMRYEADLLLVEHIEISSDEWTLPSIKIAVLADFHVKSTPEALERLRQCVELTNAEKPDLILLPGDFVAGVRPSHSAPPEKIAEELVRFQAPLGVYAVLGNHEIWHGSQSWIAALGNVGIPLLENRYIKLEYHGQRFFLVGASYNKPRTAEMWEELLPQEPLPRVIITHSPDVFPPLPEPTALAVAGHTHGGQISLPFFGSPVVPSDYGQRYASGVVKEGANTLFITRGVGTSMLPFRFRCPPEIAILTLRGASPAIPEPMIPSQKTEFSGQMLGQ